MTPDVDGDHAEPVGQEVEQRGPRLGLERDAVDEHQRPPRAALDHVDVAAVGRGQVMAHDVVGQGVQRVEVGVGDSADAAGGRPAAAAGQVGGTGHQAGGRGQADQASGAGVHGPRVGVGRIR